MRPRSGAAQLRAEAGINEIVAAVASAQSAVRASNRRFIGGGRKRGRLRRGMRRVVPAARRTSVAMGCFRAMKNKARATMKTFTPVWCVAVCALAVSGAGRAAEPLAVEVRATMDKATTAMRAIATEGGYLWRYSADLKERAGENKATETQIWVQPPGTPSVGMAFLRAYEVTQEAKYLDAAKAAADALAVVVATDGAAARASGALEAAGAVGGRSVLPRAVSGNSRTATHRHP
eukprot:gene60165-82315_t